MKPALVFFGALFMFITFFPNGLTSPTRWNYSQNIPMQKDPCDDPDADISCCFKNMPATLTSTMRIAKQDEAGTKLIITGTIFKADGKTPFPDVTIYAYHTDSKGIYSKNGSETGIQKQHGRLYGWCKTDKSGNYEIQTIRPARYPNSTAPEHIHAAVKTDSGQMHWIADFVFKDDKYVDEKYLSSFNVVGGTGVVDVKLNRDNVWIGKRDIVIK
jgi:protocatechuate 3,4-dioxygenase beta subunit